MIHKPSPNAVRLALSGAVSGSVFRAVHGAVSGAVSGAVHGAVDRAVHGGVYWAVEEAVHRHPQHPNIDLLADEIRQTQGGAT